MDIAQNVAQRILHYRQRANLTQEQLAEKVGLARPSITAIEQGKRKVSVEELVKFSTALNCSLPDLLGEEPRKNTKPEDKKNIRELYDKYKEEYHTKRKPQTLGENPLDDYLRDVNPYYYPATNEVKYED